MLRFTLPLCCLLPLAAGQESPDETIPFLGTPPIEISVDPATELWFEVRSRAASDETVGEDDPLAEAIAGARALGALFAEPRAWLLVDAYILSAQLPDGYGSALVETLRVPPKFRLPDVGPARVPRGILTLVQALDAAAPTWLEEVWPERRAQLEARRSAVHEILPPETQMTIFAELEGVHRLPFPKPSFPLRLTSRMPEVDEVALWIGGAPTQTALVAVSGREPLELADVVLHEILHVSDTRAFFPPSVFKALDTKLTRKGVRGLNAGSARHYLFYLLAGELIRRHADPAHIDQGRTSGQYERAPGLVDQLEPLVRRFASGEIGSAEFTDSYASIVAAWLAQGGEFLEEG